MIVFTTTGPLIALARIEGIDLLPKLFGTVRAAAAVIEECRVGGPVGLSLVGSLGMLAKAKVAGLLPSFREAAVGMLRAGIRFHPDLFEKVASRVSE